MKCVYVSGKYSAPHDVDRARNIFKAWEAAAAIWGLEGAYAVCPHANTMFMDGACSPDREKDYEKFIAGDLDLLARCDAVFMLSGYQNSKGAMRELAEAVRLGKKVFVEEHAGWADLENWISRCANYRIH